MALVQGDWIALVAAGVGAFAGSGSAFFLEELRRRRAEKRQQHSKLLQAQFAVSMRGGCLGEAPQPVPEPKTGRP